MTATAIQAAMAQTAAWRDRHRGVAHKGAVVKARTAYVKK